MKIKAHRPAAVPPEKWRTVMMNVTTYSNTLLTYKTEKNFYLINKYEYKDTITYILLKRLMVSDNEYYDEEIARSESEIEIVEILKSLL
jgi:hypothetical protein